MRKDKLPVKCYNEPVIGLLFNIKTVLSDMRISIIKTRRNHDRLIFIMEIPVLVR